MDALPDVVKNQWSLNTTEKKLAFLVHMRSYFATDAETIEHFKKLRKVELRKKGTPSNLILHDEAATRLEAVRDELPAGSMPDTTVGWPRGTPSLHGRAGLYNLHDLGFAVDFNATETPNLTDVRQKDLILLVTGGQAWQSGGWREGEYADMAKRTEQRAPMAEPDPKSDLGKQLAKVESEAKAASERSEAFRTSIDAKALLDLRTKRRSNKAAWAAADDAALAKVIEPWTKVVDADLTKNTKTLEAAGFDVASLKTGKALDEEKAAVSSAAAAAAKFRKGVKGDTLTDAQRTTVDALIVKLTGLVKPGAAAIAAAATDADRLKVIDELAAVRRQAARRVRRGDVARAPEAPPGQPQGRRLGAGRLGLGCKQQALADPGRRSVTRPARRSRLLHAPRSLAQRTRRQGPVRSLRHRLRQGDGQARLQRVVELLDAGRLDALRAALAGDKEEVADRSQRASRYGGAAITAPIAASGTASASSRMAGRTTKRMIPGTASNSRGIRPTPRPTLRSITSSSISPNVGREGWGAFVAVVDVGGVVLHTRKTIRGPAL